MRPRARFFLSGEGWFHTSRRILFKNAVWRGSPLTEAELAEYPARAAVASRPDCRRIITKCRRYIVSRQAQYPESETFLYERH